MKKPQRMKVTIALLVVFLITIGLLTYFFAGNDGKKDDAAKSGYKNTTVYMEISGEDIRL